MKNGEDFFKDKNDDYSSGGRPSFRSVSPDRIPVIEAIYREVLGRKPSSRELSYYKYSNINEEEIRSKLLKSEEHQKLIDDAKKVPGLEDQQRNLELIEKRLTQRIEDLQKQISESKILLDEKNNIILGLRDELRNPYDLPQQTQRYEEGFDVYRVAGRTHTEEIEKKSISDLIKEFFNLLLK